MTHSILLSFQVPHTPSRHQRSPVHTTVTGVRRIYQNIADFSNILGFASTCYGKGFASYSEHIKGSFHVITFYFVNEIFQKK